MSRALLIAAAAALLAAPVPAARSGSAGDQAVPILMYHVLAQPSPGAPYPGLYVPPHVFAAQMDWLAKHGYHAVPLRRVFDAWRGTAHLPRRPIVLSFDDGYRPDYTVALPVLRRHGWVGVLNLAVEHQWTDLPPRFVWRLVGAGWELDDHTFTHPDLTRVDPVRLQHEIAGSRSFLQREYHQPVPFFCYPSGRYDATVVAAVRAAGFLGATTTNYGLARPEQGLFTLHRVRVSAGDGVAGLAAKLR